MDNKELEKLEKWVKSIDEKLNNHLVHVAAKMTNMANDMAWIKKFFWLFASVSITAIIGAVVALIFK